MLVASEMALAGLSVPLTVADADAFLIVVLVFWVITSVGTKSEPPPLLKLTASPGATKPISTPTAPALAAASIFRLTEHEPRSMRAILPLGLTRYGSAGLPVLMEPAGHPRPT